MCNKWRNRQTDGRMDGKSLVWSCVSATKNVSWLTSIKYCSLPMAHYHCHYGFSYNLFSHMLCDFTPHFVRPSVLCLVGCLLPPKWSSDLKYGSCPPACTLDSCVSSLIVIRCALSFCISFSVLHCSITIKNSQNGNPGIRHNRKKTVSPLRFVIAGFHCRSFEVIQTLFLLVNL